MSKVSSAIVCRPRNQTAMQKQVPSKFRRMQHTDLHVITVSNPTHSQPCAAVHARGVESLSQERVESRRAVGRPESVRSRRAVEIRQALAPSLNCHSRLRGDFRHTPTGRLRRRTCAVFGFADNRGQWRVGRPPESPERTGRHGIGQIVLPTRQPSSSGADNVPTFRIFVL